MRLSSERPSSFHSFTFSVVRPLSEDPLAFRAVCCNPLAAPARSHHKKNTRKPDVASQLQSLQVHTQEKKNRNPVRTLKLMRATSYHENGRHTPTSPRKTATILTDKKPLEQGEGEPIDIERNQEEPREQGSSMRGRESLNRAITFQSNSEMETSKKKNENKTQQGDPSFGREGELSDSPAHSKVQFASYERGALLKKVTLLLQFPREREVPASQLLEQESGLFRHSSHSSFFIMSSTVILHRWIEPPTAVDLT